MLGDASERMLKGPKLTLVVASVIVGTTAFFAFAPTWLVGGALTPATAKGFPNGHVNSLPPILGFAGVALVVYVIAARVVHDLKKRRREREAERRDSGRDRR